MPPTVPLQPPVRPLRLLTSAGQQIEIVALLTMLFHSSRAALMGLTPLSYCFISPKETFVYYRVLNYSTI